MARKSNKTPEQLNEAATAKVERFRKVASARVSKALQAIETIGGCANKASYTWTPEQIEKMRVALTDAIGDALAPFSAEGAAPKKAIEL